MIPSDFLSVGFFCVGALLNYTLRRIPELLDEADSSSERTILVIDIGSSSIRCTPFAVNSQRRVRLLGTCVQKIPFKLRDVSRSQKIVDETNPSLLIYDIMEEAVDKCIVSLRGVYKCHKAIHGIGMGTFAMNIFGVDSENNPVSPLFTYANATGITSSIDCSSDKTKTDDRVRDFLTATGTILNHQSYAVTQLRAFASHHPIEAAEVKRWTCLSSFFISRWTLPIDYRNKKGQTHSSLCAVSYSEASWMGLLNFTSLKWDPTAIALSLIDENCLPALCDFNEISDRKVSPDRLSLYPELENVKFYAGIGDGAAATIGSNCLGNKRVCVTIGTSAAVRVIINSNNVKESFLPPNGLFCYRIDRNRLILGGALTDGGSLFDWLENLVGSASYKSALREVDTMYENSSYDSIRPVVVLPFWSGERSTGWHDNATGTITGLNHESTAACILLGIMEGLAYRISKIICLMRGSGLAAVDACLVSSGTALESNYALKQIIANMSGHAVVSLRSEGRGEATSYGIATMMAECMGTEQDGDCEGKGEGEKHSSSLISPSVHDVDALSHGSLPWGFQPSEIMSVTRPHTSLIDVNYIKNRMEENARLYGQIFHQRETG